MPDVSGGAALKKLLVLGLGNLLMNDDGAGLHAVYSLQCAYQDCAALRIMDGGTLGLDLLGDIAWADYLLLLDAIDIGAAPGSVVMIEGQDIDGVFADNLSPHQMGVRDILAAAELIGDRPEQVSMLGIQAESIAMEMSLSPAVRSNLPKLTQEAVKIIDQFLLEQRPW